MPTAITNDVKIDVEVAYQGRQGSEADSDYVFAYRITITNHGDYTIKLLRRHWFINDLNVAKNEVEGEGVGLQPVLEPGEIASIRIRLFAAIRNWFLNVWYLLNGAPNGRQKNLK